MNRISEALKKAVRERKVQKKEIASSKKPPKAYKPAYQPPRKLPLEERLKDRVYIAKSTDDSGIDPRIVTYFDPEAVISEQYRILRTNIQSNNISKSLKTIAISSALSSEGKSITAVNLAVTMARGLDKTVLLVDCDLRGGTIHQLLAINPAQGLSDILIDGSVSELTFYKSRIDNLTILPRGGVPRNPSELLGSKKMRRLLEELKSRFDYIILDSPPIIPLTDACVLGALVDGVIFVVQAHKTPRRMVEQAQNLLNRVHAKMLGFVLTQAEYYNPKYLYRYYGDKQRDKPDIEERTK